MSQMESIREDRYFEVRDAAGAVLSRFDFGALGLHPTVQDGLKRALGAEFGHTSLESQRQAWRCIRKLTHFLRDQGTVGVAPLASTTADEFRKWLSASPLKAATAQSALNVVITQLKWCERNAPGVIGRNAIFRVERFVREAPKQRPYLSEDQIRSVLSACYEDIEQVEAKLELGQRLTQGKWRSPAERRLSLLLGELLALGGGRLPSQRTVARSGHSYARRVREAGGFRELTRMLWLTPEALFPYYLAIVAQTGGNPMAVLDMHRQCVRPHPLRADLERVVWLKKRASQEQRMDFPAGRQWGAPSLIRRLGRLNEDLVDRCLVRDRDALFICLRKGLQSAGRPCMQMLHFLLDDFIQRHGLDGFDFRDLRRAGAVAHHRAAGTLVAAKRRLNHRSIRTTQRYTGVSDLESRHNRVIAKFQGEMVRLARAQGRSSKAADTTGQGRINRAETAFGFECKDPLAGIAPGSRIGSVCPQFHRCATCPGAVIPMDDPDIVAKLFATVSWLEQAKKRALLEGWWHRFEILYEPTRKILVQDILPAVAEDVRQEAMKRNHPQPLPWLE